MIIYKATNIVSGKIYIGKTTCGLNKRKIDHLSDARRQRHNIIFYRAIRKYGEENFKWEIIDRCLFPDVLLEMEKHYIAKFNCKTPNGYNMTDGGEGVCGCIKTKETIEKIRAAHLGKRLSPHHKMKISESERGEKNQFYGKKHSEKSKELIRQSYFKRYKKENHPNFGKHLSEETRAKISASHMGKTISEETKLKLKSTSTGRLHSDESKKKMSEIRKRYWQQKNNHID